MATIVTQANASLISYRSTAPACQPAPSRTLPVDGPGAGRNPLGACAWLPDATIRGSGVRPRSRGAAAVVTTTAAAPSEIEDEEAAVTVPSLLKAGFRFEI